MRVFLVALLLLPLAAAQGGVYMTDDLIATTQTATSYPMTDLTPEGETPGKAYLATSAGAVGYTTKFIYEVSAGFTVDGALTGVAYISCDDAILMRPGVADGPNPVATARIEVAKGATVLHTANFYSLRTCDGPADVWEASFTTEALAGTTFDAGNQLVMNVIVWAPTGYPGSGAENLFIYTGTAAYPSGITGPGLPGEEQPVDAEPIVAHQNITDGFEHSFSLPQNSTYVFSFPANGTQAVNMTANFTAGTANMTVRDGNGTELYNATVVNGTTNLTLDGAAGNWTMTIGYDGYVGDLAAAIGLAPAPVTGNVTDGAPNGTDEPQGNATADDSKDSPGLAPFAFVATLAVMAIRRRRQ